MLTATLKQKKCKNAACGTKFTPTRPMQNVCGPMCGQIVGRQKNEKKAEEAAKAERVADRVKRASMKTLAQLKAETQKEFNAYIRERDKDKPCICCGNPLGAVSGNSTGGAFDCGHYRSTGSASHLRFDERNAHGQRKVCNRYGAGRAVDYRIGLIARIGLSAVESLEADNTPRKWCREELLALKTHYRAKLRELKKEAA